MKKTSKKYGCFQPLMFHGIPVEIRDDVPTGEIWFVNEDNFIITKVDDREKISRLKALWIVIQTWASENWLLRKPYLWLRRHLLR